MVVLDTNVIIDHLRRSVDSSLLVKVFESYPEEEFGVSVISIQELFEGRSTQEERKESYLLSVLSLLRVLPYDVLVAKLAGEIARDLKHPIEFADAAIAATAMISGSRLLTINVKHFKDIPDLDLLEITE